LESKLFFTGGKLKLAQITGGKDILTLKLKVLLTSASETLFKDPNFSNYSFKKSTITVSNALNTQLFI